MHQMAQASALWPSSVITLGASLTSQTAFSSFILGREEKGSGVLTSKNCVTSYLVYGRRHWLVVCSNWWQ